MKRAIVIDDNVDFTDSFSDLLELYQIKVVGKGYDGHDAVELYIKLKPELVFLDVMMPNWDGIYALIRLKQINPDVKVIVVTADMTLVMHDTLTQLGVSSVVYKPINMNKILNLVEK